MYPAIESMTTVKVHEHAWLVRIWRTELHVQEKYDNDDLVAKVKEINDSGKATKAGLAHEIANMPRVAAVEVKDHTGMGVVVYKEWP